MGVNKKYDCFDCQKNTFSVAQVRNSSLRSVCCMRASVVAIVYNTVVAFVRALHRIAVLSVINPRLVCCDAWVAACSKALGRIRAVDHGAPQHSAPPALKHTRECF